MPPPGTVGPERMDRSAQGSLLPGGGMPPPYRNIFEIYHIAQIICFSLAFPGGTVYNELCDIKYT